MESDTSLREGILRMINEKTTLKQQVYDNTFNAFTELKEVLHEMSAELNEATEELDRRIKIEYRDRGKFEAQLQVAGDTLIFSMHTNVFEFNREHIIWQNSYVEKDKDNSYCGIVNIYNFLSDSFRYNRNADEGYLIGRIFINRESQYFVEGKRQVSLRHNNFGSARLDKPALAGIAEAAVNYSLEFDLLVPPYDAVKIVSVDQMNTKIENSKMQTGKRLGYRFNSDDI
ncbi:MAG: hypothetical protein LBU80_04465 [Rikenellaceae bacterium]|jgi:hypothetical protein|nr:hypothetical protein [Rikenellaceae bacterium]